MEIKYNHYDGSTIETRTREAALCIELTCRLIWLYCQLIGSVMKQFHRVIQSLRRLSSFGNIGWDAEQCWGSADLLRQFARLHFTVRQKHLEVHLFMSLQVFNSFENILINLFESFSELISSGMWISCRSGQDYFSRLYLHKSFNDLQSECKSKC